MEMAQDVSTVPSFALTIDAIKAKRSLLRVLRELGPSEPGHPSGVFW